MLPFQGLPGQLPLFHPYGEVESATEPPPVLYNIAVPEDTLVRLHDFDPEQLSTGEDPPPLAFTETELLWAL